MKPIKRSLLPNTVTLYNCYRDPDSGVVEYFDTKFQYTRIMNVSKTVHSGTTGWTRILQLELWIDPFSSFAYATDSQGNKIKKIYAKPAAWEAMNNQDKARHWTLQPLDLIVEGQIDFILTADNQDQFMQQHRPNAIESIIPVLDKPGNVHHWEVNLV